MKQSVCLNCEKRHLGCHDKCEEYQEFKKCLAEVKKAKVLESVKDTCEYLRKMGRRETRFSRLKAGLRG